MDWPCPCFLTLPLLDSGQVVVRLGLRLSGLDVFPGAVFFRSFRGRIAVYFCGLFDADAVFSARDFAGVTRNR